MGKSNKVALVCQVCGATFYKVPSAITVETRCCSKECRGKVQAERLEQRRRELAKELEGLRTESPEGEKRRPNPHNGQSPGMAGIPAKDRSHIPGGAIPNVQSAGICDRVRRKKNQYPRQ